MFGFSTAFSYWVNIFDFLIGINKLEAVFGFNSNIFYFSVVCFL